MSKVNVELFSKFRLGAGIFLCSAVFSTKPGIKPGSWEIGPGLLHCSRLNYCRKTMIRKSFVMSVNPGMEAEYERRHRPIWEDLQAVLKSHGVHNYSIFLHPETRQLFGYAEVEDEARWNAIAQTEVCQRWWAYMKDVMPSNPDNSPVATELKEVFYLP